MDSFQEREQAAEALFTQKLAAAFRERMTRIEALSLWASERMGLDGEAAVHYREALAKLAVASADDRTVFAKVRADFVAAKLVLRDGEIEKIFNAAVVRAPSKPGG